MASIALRTPLMGIALFILAWLLAMAPALLYPWSHPNQQPLLSVPSAVQARKFSVGFSLQSSYGAAVVIFEDPNGELQTHASVHHGCKEYRAVMAKLSLLSSRHLAPPYQDNGEYFDDQPRRAVRNALKKLGLPASYEVGVLAGVIQHLRSELELAYSIRISEAVFTSSHLLGLYQDDLMDMADHVGIKYVTPKNQFKPIIWETAAAYAGYGLGMCEHWEDDDWCRKDFEDIPGITLLAVHYSRNALTVSLVPVRNAIGAFEPDFLHDENFTLGSDAISGYSHPEDYWSGVKDLLLYTMRTFPGFPKPDKIMITGDMAHENFMNFLEETITQYMGFVPPIISEEAQLAAAKGAAEFMRRGPAPWS
ncbi:Uncharacterized protein TCAP_06365 [Tolypocladium capitatum]|uniref:Uncharacterized protein n=1 Tax=Tolypocladium capitatum TaxID=45235 RepID=A0A2K3Q803_9HYPO|nr:Uncharacterized protein TCAP_06365 [Tolypocladium capitatum]